MRVDEKYNVNLTNYSSAEQELINFQNTLDSLSNSDSVRREEIRTAMQSFKDTVNSNLIEIKSEEWGKQVSVRGGEYYGQVAFGEVKTGGAISFMSTDEGDDTGLYLHMLVTTTCHEIDGFVYVYSDGHIVFFDGALYPNESRWATNFFQQRIFTSCKNLGTEDQAANSNLVSQSALLFPEKFTAAHRQRGHSGIYFILVYDIDKFPNGIPELTARFKGYNQVYDPRIDATTYSNNAALCLAAYITDTNIGAGYTLEDLDLESLSTAADVCDERVILQNGAGENRYECNGVFEASSSNDHKKIMQEMALAMGGYICNSGGKWRFYAGAYSTPVVDLDESDLRSGMKITAKPGKDSILNRIKGQYRGDLTDWEWGDYPPIQNSFYIDIDGEELEAVYDFAFVSSSSQCQRIAKIKLEEARQWIQVEAEFCMKMYQAICGENVTITNERMGWEQKPFRIIDYSFNSQFLDSGEIITIRAVLRETAAGIFDWNNGEETIIDLAPNTQLPDPTKLPIPQNLTLSSGTAELDIRTDGTVFSRIYLTWDATTNPFVLTDGSWFVQYKKSSEEIWRTSGYIDGEQNSHWILDLADGELYDVRVRAETNFKGEWAVAAGYLVLGKQEKPSTPSNLRASTSKKGILLEWDGITDLDLSYYEIRRGATFVSGVYVDVTTSTSYLIPTQASGHYYFTLAAKDTSKIYSDAIAVEVVIIGPGRVGNLKGVVIYNMVQLSWDAPTGWSFPIKEYKIYRGNTFGSATYLGSVSATLKALQEFLSGTYTYWVTAVDEYGNESLESGVTLVVDAPPFFQLFDKQDIDFTTAITLTNILIEDGTLLAPVNTTETWQEHFVDNSFATPQAQIDAGYPLYIEPATLGNGIFESVIDYGGSLGAVIIGLSISSSWIDGSGEVIPTISYSADGSSYTDGQVGSYQIIGTSFRYVKIKLAVAADDRASIVRISSAIVTLQVKRTRDEGTLSAISTDASGTEIIPNYTFLDVFEGSIKLLPQGSTAAIASYAVVENAVKVFLWNTSGVRISGTVAWSLEGIIGE